MDRGTARAGEDELTLIKAAAWAWYQHNSAVDGKSPVREFDLRHPRWDRRPSRYSIEAQFGAHAHGGDSESVTSESERPSPTKTDMSLLDAYEIERISRQLDHALECSRRLSLYGERPGSGQEGSEKRRSASWIRRAAGVCGAGSEVVEAVERPRRRYAEVVGFHACRPGARRAGGG